MAQYYAQRAGAGLIVSEATVVMPMGVGYADTPGIWSAQQIEGWKTVTQAVHEAGGRIFLQLWHVGRVSDPMFLDGALPVAPSAIAPIGNVSLVRPPKPYVIPRALRAEEIAAIVDAFRKGAENAQIAGFDGVELHGANGYLLDQFLQDGSNSRTDEYGGSIENRARLMLEAADAAVGPDSLGPKLKAAFRGVYVANEKYTFETASHAVMAAEADAVAFGKLFIANPDLPKRFKLGAALNEVRAPLFYTGAAEGYTDYPSL